MSLHRVKCYSKQIFAFLRFTKCMMNVVYNIQAFMTKVTLHSVLVNGLFICCLSYQGGSAGLACVDTALIVSRIYSKPGYIILQKCCKMS